MNKMSLSSKLREISFKTGIDYNLLLLRFFMEEFLIRVSLSPYREKFIFKGGFFLSSLLGISNRTTMDMDVSIRNYQLEELYLKDMIAEITENYGDQSISFEIQAIKPILDNNEYGGICVKVIGKLENIRQPFGIDFATGDPVTPSAIYYDYRLMINDKVVKIKAYNLETVVAEKLQTILVRGLANSRSKDFYDLYIIYKTQIHDLNMEHLNDSVQNTFKYRETKWDIDEALSILNLIKSSRIMETRWNQFSKSHPFAQGLDFVEIINVIIKIIENIEIEINVH